MNKQYLLGIDIGTSSIKVLITDLKGNRIAAHTHLYETMQPFPGFVEQDAKKNWWEGASIGIQACIETSGIEPQSIAGICACGMVPNLCPVDISGEPIRPAILYRDNRAIDQVARLNTKFDWGFNAEGIIPKLLWIKENEPENYERIYKILNSHSYLAYKMTGRFTVDRDIASIHGAVYDVHTGEWMMERMEAMGLKPTVLPELLWGSDVVGTVTEAAAKETGLAPGTPVVSGTGDSFTALVGCGSVEKGDALIYLGTAGTFLGLNTSIDDIKGKHIFSEGYGMFLGNVLTGGEITHWAKDNMLKDCNVDYTMLEEAASHVEAGCDGLIALPHLLGERTPVADPMATGVFYGLSNAHTLGHMYRALLEGVAFALKDSYLENAFTPNRLILFGGGCNCRLWRQIIADVLGMTLEYIPNADNGMGTAFLAGIGVGAFDSYGVIKREWLKEKEAIEPIPENVERYQKIFAFYRSFNACMHAINADHHKLMETLRD